MTSPNDRKPRFGIRRAADENIPVAELAKSFGRQGESPKVLATSATAGKDLPKDRKLHLAMRALVLPLSLLLSANGSASEGGNPMNLLLNPGFEFHAFENHRHGRAVSFESHNVAFWNTGAWGDITVMRESHVRAEIRPGFTTHNLVSIAPGKRFWQFFTLPEASLGHDDRVSLLESTIASSAGPTSSSTCRGTPTHRAPVITCVSSSSKRHSSAGIRSSPAWRSCSCRNASMPARIAGRARW